MTRHSHNTDFIHAEAAWLERALAGRMTAHAEGSEYDDARILHHAPPLPPPGTAYGDVVREAELGHAERLVLMLALLPHIRPEVLDPLLIRSEALQRRFTEFGGLAGGEHAGFLPTQQTALFLLAGGDLAARLHHLKLFAPDRPLYAQRILMPPPRGPDGLPLAAGLRLEADCLERLLTG